ncbi:hypothetical protein N7520_003407 [Penicillium odoratum]|uniref:uncharacterized protein n=1 Tax=Penicillium odoratum TaxID=1167516 RepID=UPI0025488FE1|nr:uncharacterized protein N7520_003407 [Penicillium odoratum]KAJ5768848.1 hypothetical protein N7520_003407 [Penicillium odoratum]
MAYILNMASTSTSQEDGHFSFAKIAAMPAPTTNQPCSISDINSAQPEHTSNSAEQFDAISSLPTSHHLTTFTSESSTGGPVVHGLERAVQDINLQKDHDSSSVDDSESGLPKRDNFFDDDRTHLSTSSTKLTNFDSKSLASVTTFAMDEKDSVRPDDSASVQAIDEEESLSGLATGAPNSVTGSEAGGRGYRDQFRDGNGQRPRGILPLAGPLYNGGLQRTAGTIPPDSVSNNFVIAANPDCLQDNQPLNGFPLEPDEKLLEAMKSPKDRLMILQLEENIRCFIQDDSEQSLELPPSNAFGRLLAHKLGDYYHLTHFVDNNVTSVRLHRTPFCRLPTPLSDIHAATNTAPPPTLPAMKIMRRTDGERPSVEGSVGASSSVPSKAPSEAGDGQDSGSSGGSPTKDRLALTREEREAKYNQARERIFRDFPDSAKSDPASGDSNPNMSRSSSTTGRKKNGKQRTPHDDGFVARSLFNTYYNSPCNNDASYSNPVPFLVGPGVPPPTGGFVPSGGNGMPYLGNMGGNMGTSMGTNMGVNNVPQYPMGLPSQMASNGQWQGGNPQQSPYSGYASMNQSGMSQQSSTKSSPAMSNFAIPQSGPYQQFPSWNGQSYQGNYPQGPYQPAPHQAPHQQALHQQAPHQQAPHQRNKGPGQWPYYPSAQSMTPNMASYPYAQYPGQHLNPSLQNPNGSPMQGNMARSHFNPQTRSFVPGGASAPRHPLPSYPNMTPGAQGQWNGYPEPAFNRNVDHGNQARPSNTNSRDSIAKWGTPSHLPPKPPPSEVPSDFDMKHRAGPTMSTPPSYPSGIVGAKNGPLVVSGGNSTSKTH